MLVLRVLVVVVLLSVLSGFGGVVSAQDEYTQGLAEARVRWERLAENRRSEWDEQVQDARDKWGETLESSRSSWVEYGESSSSYFRADFENGEIEIVALDVGHGQEAALRAIAERLRALLATPGNEDQLLEGQLEGSPSAPEPVSDPEQFISEVLETVETAGMVVGADGETRQSYAVRLELLPDHIETRAAEFSPLVHKWAARFGQDPALVFAIIQSESFFNPAAVSHAGAIGLMQLVPTSGGLQASEYLLDRREVPSEALLYEPRVNIAFGVGYMKWMTDNYFGGDLDRAETYQLICGYNCGPERVRRIVEESGVSPHSADDVYAVLHESVPDETREYLDRVLSRWEMYRETLAG